MNGIELWWLGQSGFRLRDLDSGRILFIDPFLSEYEGRIYPAPITPDALAPADIVLCTHEHDDHLDRPALQAAIAQPGSSFTLLVPQPIVDQALELGMPPQRVVGAQPDDPIEFAEVHILPVPARHGVNASDAYTFGEELSKGLVRYLGYVLTLGGVRIYHAGDTLPYEGQVERLRALQPDLALLPINGRDFYRETEKNIVGNMDPREAMHLAVESGAKVLVPIHWDLLAFNRGYPDEVAACSADYAPNLSLLILGRNARFTYLPQTD